MKYYHLWSLTGKCIGPSVIPQICNADDPCVSHSSKQFLSLDKELNIALQNVVNWLKANKLNLNVKKYNLLLFNPDRNRTKEKLNIHLDTEAFEQK